MVEWDGQAVEAQYEQEVRADEREVQAEVVQ